MKKTILAAFNQGTIPTLSCANLAKTPLGADFKNLSPRCRSTRTGISHRSGARHAGW